jgi:AbrB family transcriptional regulator (stage V sporulation protein T)
MKLMVDRMGRVVVPKAIRSHFALKPGDELELTIESDGIRLRPVAPATALADEGGLLVCSSELPTSAADLGALLEEQRARRSAEIGGL